MLLSQIYEYLDWLILNLCESGFCDFYEVEIVENVVTMMEVEEESEKEVSLDDVNLQNGSFMVVDDDSQADKRSSLHVTDICSFEAYRKTFKSAENRSSKLKARGFGDALKERCRGLL